ncbi:MAG TPA: DUF4286 family protein [Flavisolibacter sp.]|nr:DUF4286 family protein [Flavisolibacter sp.]
MNTTEQNPALNTGSVIYNVTTKVDKDIAEAWLHWLLNEHIPDLIQTKCFLGYRVVRLIEVDDSEGPTYAVQYFAESKSDYNRYIQMFAEQMREKTYEKWGDRCIAFRSVMQVVQ